MAGAVIGTAVPMRAAYRRGSRRHVALLVLCLLLCRAALPGAALAAVPVPARDEPPPRGLPARPSFGHLTTEHGLSDLRVWSLLQDRAGFLWIGTTNGLDRYDGYDIVAYRHDPQDPHSISGNVIQSLYEDRAGTLWIGTRSGLNAYDPRSERFTRYRHDPADSRSLSHDAVQAIYQDSTGAVWVGTAGGLDRLDPATGSFTHVRSDPETMHSLSNDLVRAIAQDRDGMLWIGTAAGLNRLDPATGKLTVYRSRPGDPHALADDHIFAILVDRSGSVWIGTDGGGLSRWNRERDTFTTYRHAAADPHSLSDDRVDCLFEDQHGALWVGTFNGGMSVLDPAGRRFVNYRREPANPASLGNDQVADIIADRSGLIWIATQGNGVDIYNPQQEAFGSYRNDPAVRNSLASNRVSAVLEDADGRLWVGTQDQGLNRIDRRSGSVIHYAPDPANPEALGFPFVSALERDPSGAVWVGTYGGGLYRLDPQSGVFTPYRHDDAVSGSLSGDTITALHLDRSGALWIATTQNGLNRLDPRDDGFVAYRNDPDDPGSLSSDAVWALAEEPSGAIWAATMGGGINRLDRATGTFTRYRHNAADPQSLSDDNVYAMHVDRSGTVWAGTFGGGLNRFNPQQGTFTRYLERDGLASDKIISITEDGAGDAAAGNLWLATGRGIAKLDRDRTTYHTYDAADGLPRTELTRGHALSSSGEVLVGSFEGLLSVDTAAVQDDRYAPPLVFTDFLLANKPVTVGEASVLKQALGWTENLVLPYSDRVLSFKFAALSYRAPQQNRYRYRLEGFDTDWTEVDSTRRLVTYTNLDPGSYTFHVQASNGDGVWNTTGGALRFTIVPPWWQALWFQLLALAALLSTVALGYRRRTRASRAQQRYLEQQVAERTQALNQRADELAASAAELRSSEARYRELAERLRSSEQRYRQLVHNFPDGAVFLFDRELRQLIADGSSLAAIGYEQSRLEGKMLAETVDPETFARLEPIYRATLAGTAPRELELEAHGRVFRVTPVSLHEPDGRISSGMLIVQDVTERHVYETAMVRLNVQLEQRVGERTTALSQSLRALSDSMRFGDQVAATSPALLLVVDLQSEQLVYGSRDPVAFFGLHQSAARANGARAQMVPAALSGEHGLLRPPEAYAQLQDGAVIEYEAEVEPVDDSPRWYAVRASAFRRDAGGAVVHVLIAALDITGRRKMEDELRAFQRQQIHVQDAERAHIARELHDQIGQLLTGLNLTLAAAGHSDGPSAAQLIGRAQMLVSELTSEVRRLSVALRPAMLDDLGLLATLAWHTQQVEEQTGIRVTLEHDGLAATIAPETAMAAYRLVQESLTNVARHAATDAATVLVWVGDNRLHIQVSDRGRGFDPQTAAPAESSGLRGMRERVGLLGGTLAIESQPGAGTTVDARLPLCEAGPPAKDTSSATAINSEGELVKNSAG